jgi:adenylate cyclase
MSNCNSNQWRMPRPLAGLLFSIGSWCFIGAFFFLLRSYGTNDVFDWMTGPVSIILMTLVVGVVIGSLDWGGSNLIDHSRLRSKPFWILLILKTMSLTIALFGVIFLARFVAMLSGKFPLSELPTAYLNNISSDRFMVSIVYVAVGALVMSFIRQSAAMVGPRILVNLMTGRYHHPREEELIFMFLDMKASTTLAERLGHRQFSRLLQDCFRDLTEVAIKHRVEIYKYVGDEAILSWNPRDGLHDGNCLRVFFGFCDTLEKRRKYYTETYDCFPEFKAGLNIGLVTVAEVGILKREIAYLSDVLNTAARIQGQCNEIGQTLLLSGSLHDRLEPAGLFSFRTEGEIELRGREEKVALFSVELLEI